MRIFLDTNVVLDYLTERMPFADDAETVVELCTRDGNEGVITSLSACNIIYVLSKVIGRHDAEERLEGLLSIIGLVGIDPHSIRNNLLQTHADYEDAVQLSEAIRCNADIIVTRDLRGFSNSSIPVYTPADFVAKQTNNSR